MTPPITKLEDKLFRKWIDAPGLAPKELKAYTRVVERNRRQRARRASPEAKAEEVLANRKSRTLKKLRRLGLNGCVKRCFCNLCTQARALGIPELT
jgi:hypothetical protein